MKKLNSLALKTEREKRPYMVISMLDILAMKIDKRKDIPEPAVKQQEELHRSLRPPHSTWLNCGG